MHKALLGLPQEDRHHIEVVREVLYQPRTKLFHAMSSSLSSLTIVKGLNRRSVKHFHSVVHLLDDLAVSLQVNARRPCILIYGHTYLVDHPENPQPKSKHNTTTSTAWWHSYHTLIIVVTHV